MFAGITLACSQIGSALVALPSFFQETLIVPGALILVALGLMVLVTCYYLQELWLYMRRSQLDAGSTSKQSEAYYQLQEDTINTPPTDNPQEFQHDEIRAIQY